jgi:hypothetical protein
MLILVLVSGCIAESLNTNNNLNIGDTSITKDDIEITVTEYKFVDHFEKIVINNKITKCYPPEGAKFLIIYLKVTNVGLVETPTDTISFNRFSSDTPTLLYAGNEIKATNNIAYGASDSYSEKIYYSSASLLTTYDLFVNLDDDYKPKFTGYGKAYPNVTKEGWIAFSVPANIDLSETELQIHGLKWSF